MPEIRQTGSTHLEASIPILHTPAGSSSPLTDKPKSWNHTMVIRSFVIDINDSIKVPKTRQLQRAGDRLRRTRELYVDDMYR